ncbi:MAG: helix-turn-helix domain-containing protein [Anaerotignaceae bacterium]
MNIGEAIGNRILDLCNSRKISLNKLSTMCGITQSTLNNIVSGISKNPTVSTIKKVCDGLNISLSDFFDTDIFRNLDQEVR